MKHGVKVGLLVLAVLLGGYLLYEGMQVFVQPSPSKQEFTATTLDGDSWSLSEHLQQGPVLFNFFSTT